MVSLIKVLVSKEAYKVSFVITWLPREGGREAEVSAAFCLQLGVQVQGDLFLSLQGAKAWLASMPLVRSHSREGGIALCCSSSPSIPTEHPSHSAVRGAAFRSHRVSAVLSFGRCLSNRMQHGHRFNSVFQPWYIDINSNGGSWALVIHWRHRLSSCRIRGQYIAVVYFGLQSLVLLVLLMLARASFTINL